MNDTKEHQHDVTPGGTFPLLVEFLPQQRVARAQESPASRGHQVPVVGHAPQQPRGPDGVVGHALLLVERATTGCGRDRSCRAVEKLDAETLLHGDYQTIHGRARLPEAACGGRETP